MKIVVIKPDHLGDFAVGLPSLWEASQRLSNPADLHVLARSANCEWSELLPWLPRVHPVYYPKYARAEEEGGRHLGRSLREVWQLGRAEGGFDWGIELTSWDAAPWGKVFLRAAGARRIRGMAVRGQRWLLHEPVLARGGSGHQTRRLAARFPAEWGIRGEAGPAEFMPAQWRWKPAAEPRPIAVMPWAGEAFKEWPLERWRELRKAAPAPWRLLTPKNRVDDARAWRDAVGQGIEVVEVRSVRDSLAALRDSSLTLSVDTAVAHYAWLVGAPLVELFSAAAEPAQWGSLANGELIAAETSRADLTLEAKRRAAAELMQHVTVHRVREALLRHLTPRHA